ncbi:MAG: acetyl-CoA C-acetyltransferase [Ardenticatenia bacterium]|nr:MAG: acetyl-CoA C-acetyltransferase [Ardenticatenia bacterium]
MPSLNPKDIVILDGARTPVGTFLGSLRSITPTDLGAIAARAALERSGVPADAIDAVFVGNVIQSARDTAYIARHVGLKAGVPIETPALTVNRLCGSGQEAIVQGAKALMLGEATFVLAGGAENMSMSPYALRGVREGWKLDAAQVEDMLWAALTDYYCGCAMADTAENVAEKYGITREEADEFALLSHQRAAAARESGRLAKEIVPVEVRDRKGRPVLVEHDEHIRPDTSLEKLARLPARFRENGRVTAGNASGMNDAACMLVLTTWEVAQAHGLKPLGRLVSWGTAGVDPAYMGMGPVPASKMALERAGLTLDQMDVVEVNEAFATQYLAVERELGLDREKTNPNGGGISIGHPLGATGARVTLTALYELRERGGRYGLATMCIGGGQGIAAIVEYLGA